MLYLQRCVLSRLSTNTAKKFDTLVTRYSLIRQLSQMPEAHEHGRDTSNLHPTQHTPHTHPILGVFEADILDHDDRRWDFPTGREIE